MKTPLALLTCFALIHQAVVAEPASPAMILVNADVLDPTGERLLPHHDVLIVDGRISAVGKTGTLHAPESAKRIDLAGLTLVPGLIDLHTHLLLHPYDEATWNDQVLKESLGRRTIQAVVAAEATLRAGFTTIRDLGTEGAGYTDVALRNATDRGLIPGPRIFAATRAIVATGCYGPSGFAPRFNLPKGAQMADGVAGVRRAVREQIAGGADWIKVYADYRRRPGDASTPTFSQQELDAIVDEANSAGLPVSAHASTSQAIRRAVLAGVRTIEHGIEANAETMGLMAEHDVTLCPTLAASEAMARYSGWHEGQPDHPRIQEAKQSFARALRAGVRIACGSDAGVFSHGLNARELELMVAYGMTAPDALRAATAVAADVLGLGDSLGRIDSGFIADLIAVNGNPLRDPSKLRHPTIVIRRGKIAVDRRPDARPHSR